MNTMNDLKGMFKTESRIFKKLIANKTNKNDVAWVIKFFEEDLRALKVHNVTEAPIPEFEVNWVAEKIDTLKSKMEIANSRLIEIGIFDENIFINPDDAEQSIRDYDYYYMPRTRPQYAQEEADAKSGKNGRIPMDREIKKNTDV